MKTNQIELDSRRQKEIIDGYLEKIMKDEPDLYYTSASDLARKIHTLLDAQMSRLSLDDQLIMKKTTMKDIEVILSFN